MTEEQLIGWRETMGLIQREAADLLGMSENAYRSMEKGESSISRRTELACIALYVGPDKLAQPWRH